MRTDRRNKRRRLRLPPTEDTTSAATLTDFTYAGIKELSERLHRPLSSLIVLAGANDPFYAGLPSRLAAAKWFAKHWHRLHIRHGLHLRGIHYIFVSQKKPLKMWNGEPYENLYNECWVKLINASRDARYLGLVPRAAFIDQHSEEPLLAIVEPDNSAFICVSGDDSSLQQLSDSLPPLPELVIGSPQIRQRFLIEIWVEKSTLSNILLPLHHTYGVNIITGVGELSEIRCRELVDRARQDGRPVRILFLSDFDPGGASMPVAAARKIEFHLRTLGLRLDIEVRPVLLTYEQCRRYRLPRAPIKEGERRAGRFEERFGEGATELDALEALHPGEIDGILEQEILRYYDPNLQRNIRRVTNRIERELEGIDRQVHDEFADQYQQLEDDYAELVERYEEELQAIAERQETLQLSVTERLEEQAPEVEDYNWPEPRDGDEDPDPMFKSTRGYVEQIDRFKRHQGKLTTRRPRAGEPFESGTRRRRFQSRGRQAAFSMTTTSARRRRRT
jgi:hypothetical protein